MKNWLWADYLLYDHFKAKLDGLLQNLPQADFSARLEAFGSANMRLFADCVQVKGDNKFLFGKYKMALPIVMGYVVDESKQGCVHYAISEPNFAFMLHSKQDILFNKP